MKNAYFMNKALFAHVRFKFLCFHFTLFFTQMAITEYRRGSLIVEFKNKLIDVLRNKDGLILKLDPSIEY